MMHRDVDELTWWLAMDASALDWLQERESLAGVVFRPSLCYRLSTHAMLRDPPKWCRNRMRAIEQRVRRAVATFLLMIGILFATVLAVSPTARATVKQWLMEWYEGESVEYHFTNNSMQGDPTDYELTYIPEGYVEVDRIYRSIRRTVFFQDENENLLRFICQVMESGTAASLWSNSFEVKYIDISGHQGELLLSNDPSLANNLVWHDAELNLQFSLHGFVDESTLIAMAESVKPLKSLFRIN